MICPTLTLPKSANDWHADQGVDVSVAIAITAATDLPLMYLAEELSRSHSLSSRNHGSICIR